PYLPRRPRRAADPRRLVRRRGPARRCCGIAPPSWTRAVPARLPRIESLRSVSRPSEGFDMTCRLCRGASLGVLLVLAGVVASLPTAADDQADVDLTIISGGKDFTNSLGMKLVRIRAGKFLMGAPKGEEQAESQEFPQHEVELTKDYYLAAHEVTQK